MAHTSQVTDVMIICPTCLELFDSPKSLPCLHTFCFKCIEAHYRDSKPGEDVDCPVCKAKFHIPENGVKGLVSNFFIAGLVEARKTASDVKIPVPCEVCLAESDQDGSSVAVSTMYCVDCHQKLCELCCKPHRRMKPPHNVLAVESGVENELIKTRGQQDGKCDKHRNECVKLYCFDCKMNICFMCFAEEHKAHDSRNIETVAHERIRQIDVDVETTVKLADEARDEVSRIDEERRRCLAVAEDVGDKITARGEELKQLIEKQVNEMMLTVQALKTEACKEVDSHRENTEVKLLAFETFSAYCSELKAKGKPYDITRAANDLHIRATELQQTGSMPTDFSAKEVTFRPMHIHELLADGETLIGSVYLFDKNSDCTKALSPCISSVTRREMILEQQLRDAVDRDMKAALENHEKTVKSYEEQLQQLRESEDELNVKLLTSEKSVKELQKQREDVRKSNKQRKSKLKNAEKSVETLQAECEKLRESEASLKAALDTAGEAVKTLEEQVELLRKSECDAKGKLEKSESMVKCLNGQLKQLRKSENSLKAELNIAAKKQKELQKQLKQTEDSKP